VVIHEFIHKIDMRDGQPDGCPPLPSRGARERWLAVMQAEFEAFREKSIIAERFGGEPTWLDPYGATSIDEFFAVACEAYFVNRGRFDAEFPSLSPLFSSFFAG
jgi:Mlc titration factor MtfA (ptsG expression regulator)